MRNERSTTKGKASNRRNDSSRNKKDFNKSIKSGGNPSNKATPQLVKDTANFQYGWPLGSRISIASNENDYISNHDISIPGIMSLVYYPSIGVSTDANSPINVAVRNLYTFVRHLHTGSKTYDAPDLMLYNLALNSLYTFHAFMVRAYGCLTLTAYRNRYMPEALFKSFGLDYQNFIGHASDFRTYINIFAHQIGAMALYKGSNFTFRNMELTTNIYKESEVVKSQMYVFNPGCYYRYIETDGPGKLEAVEAVTNWNNLTFDELRAYGDTLKEYVLASEDMNIMSADMLKAFGQENMVSLPYIDETYTVDPIFDISMNVQIQNANVLGVSFSDMDLDITQDEAGVLHYSPINLKVTRGFSSYADIQSWKEHWVMNKLINMPIDNPTPIDTFMATRFVTTFDKSVSDDRLKYLYTMRSCGTEFIGKAYILYYKSDDNGNWTVIKDQILPVLDMSPFNDITATNMKIRRLSMKTAFGWAPQTYALVVNTDGEGITACDLYPMFDIENYAIISKLEVDKMNLVHLSQSFEVPLTGLNIK